MAKELFKAAEPAQNERVRQYTNLANQYGVSPDMIIYSPYNDLLGQVDEYLAANPDVVAAPPAEVPGLTVTPSHGRMDYSKKSDDEVLKEAGIR
jgi:hypothetical protein